MFTIWVIFYHSGNLCYTYLMGSIYCVGYIYWKIMFFLQNVHSTCTITWCWLDVMWPVIPQFCSRLNSDFRFYVIGCTIPKLLRLRSYLCYDHAGTKQWGDDHGNHHASGSFMSSHSHDLRRLNGRFNFAVFQSVYSFAMRKVTQSIMYFKMRHNEALPSLYFKSIEVMVMHDLW